MRGHVSLTDGKNKLWCEELTYNLGTKVAVYDNKGTLQADSTLVTSQKGVYNVKTKEARFGGHVIVTDPQYYTTSEDMEYNTDTKLTRFFDSSVVRADSGRNILQTRNGTYDAHIGIADLYSHSSVWYDGYYLEGDTIHYSKLSGFGYAIGKVIGIDTGHHATLFCGKATYNRKKRILWALEKPVLETVNGKDTFYMRADTFYSAPMTKGMIKKEKSNVFDTSREYGGMGNGVVSDTGGQAFSGRERKRDSKRGDDTAGMVLRDTSLAVVAPNSAPLSQSPKVSTDSSAGNGTTGVKKGGKKGKANRQPPPDVYYRGAVDTSVADTSAPLYFTGYHHVRIFSDSMQGVCDSIIYTRSDSTVRMIYNPILWARNSQVTGDTILMLLDSNKIKNVYVPNNAFVVSLAGPPKAGLYDQVQGKTLKGFFKNNTITYLVVTPNAEAIYYPKDDSGFFIGASQANSERMRIYFDNQKIKTIKFEKDVHQDLIPLEKADLPNMRLSRFKWLFDLRPKTKEELFK